jgi:hypothetical protein
MQQCKIGQGVQSLGYARAGGALDSTSKTAADRLLILDYRPPEAHAARLRALLALAGAGGDPRISMQAGATSFHSSARLAMRTGVLL